jgi:hypothetical protein
MLTVVVVRATPAIDGEKFTGNRTIRDADRMLDWICDPRVQ